MGHQRDYSEEVAADIDDEVRALIEAAHDEAWEILVEYRDVLDAAGARADRQGDAVQGATWRAIFAPVAKRPAAGPVQRLRQARRRRDQPPVLTPAEQAARATANGHVHGSPTAVGDVGAPAQR